MKYLYKKTGAVVESGIRLNPAIFKPIMEEESVSAKKEKSAIVEEASSAEVPVKEAPAVTDQANTSSAESSTTTSTTKKTTARKTTSAKK